MPGSFWNDFLIFLEKSKSASSMLCSLLKQVNPTEITDEKIILSCTNPGLRFFLQKRVDEIEQALSSYLNHLVVVDFITSIPKKNLKEVPLLNFQPSVNDILKRSGLNPKYGFSNFAVSSTNQVAFAAAQAVTNGLGHAYNPLFIYGGVGVGKTHLAQAVGKKILEEDGEKKVLFCPGDSFTNELIESIRNNSSPRFRRKYRYLSLLIIDDVQFIAGKKAVQEEFFHTFNSIVSSGGQIILTSDRPPDEIKNLEDRLRSRFSGGLIVDVQPPDFELRTAILLIKAKEKNIEIDINTAKVVSDQIKDNRALEGTLLSLYTKSLNENRQIDLELIDDFFSQRNSLKIKKIIPSDVLKIVCSFYNVRMSHLKGPERNFTIVLPRQIAMFILRTQLKLRLEEIALLLRRKDHTTVIHAVEKINRQLMKDINLKQEIEKINSSLFLST